MARKRSPGQPSQPPDPDRLAAAARHLRRALAALGEDPAARLVQSALTNIERRATGDPAAGAGRPLVLQRAEKGHWQLWSGRRVVRSYPAAWSHGQAWTVASYYAARKKRPILDKTTPTDR